VQGAGCRVQGVGCRVQGSGCIYLRSMVLSFGPKVQGLGVGVQDNGFLGAPMRKQRVPLDDCARA
jgi:hypothetical protein